MVPWIFRIKKEQQNMPDTTMDMFGNEKKENMEALSNPRGKNFEETEGKMLLPWQFMINGPMLRV